MATKFYDDALIKKIKSWIHDESITITGPDETSRLFSYQLDKKDDEPIKLPLIALRRLPSITIQSVNKKPLSFDGATINGDLEQRKISLLNGIPITLSYAIDIYTRYFAEADEYVREFIFKLINNPKLTIEIPYNNSKIEHNANIILDPTVVDNSNIPERLIPGQFTRFTINFYIDDAYLFDYKYQDIKNIEIPQIQVDLTSTTHIKN